MSSKINTPSIARLRLMLAALDWNIPITEAVGWTRIPLTSSTGCSHLITLWYPITSKGSIILHRGCETATWNQQESFEIKRSVSWSPRIRFTSFYSFGNREGMDCKQMLDRRKRSNVVPCIKILDVWSLKQMHTRWFCEASCGHFPPRYENAWSFIKILNDHS